MGRQVTRRNALKLFGSAVAGAAVAGSGLTRLARVGPLVADAGARAGASNASGLTGRVVQPLDAAYEAARQGWDALFSTYPAAVVFVQSPDDVVNAVRWARTHDTVLRVRSGRHCLEGWSSIDGGLVVDVSDLKQITIDRNAKTATVGTGVTQGELHAALAGAGLGFPTGDEAGIGLGGGVLGGGIGQLSRRMGPGCDNLLQVELVVPSGRRSARLVRCDTAHNSDLLWACRGGGGGNFGVATSYVLRLQPLPDPLTVWQINWPFDALPDAYRAWQRWAPHADTRLSSTLDVRAPSSGLQADGVFLGPQAQLESLLDPVTTVAGAQVKLSVSSWADRFKKINSGPRQNAFWKFTPSWAYRELSPQAIDTIGSFMRRAPSPVCDFWSLAWGGQARRPPAGGAAFFHRQALFYAEPGAGWNDPALTEACVTWVGDFRQAMLDHVEGGYVNVPDRAIADFGTSYYGTNFERLREVKRRWDPDNVFHFEQSIPL